MEIKDRMKKEDFYMMVSNNSLDGTLGFFIGAGFVKSLCKLAKNWKELINDVAKNLDIELKKEWSEFAEPVRFSLIADIYSEKNKISFEESQLKVKDEIAKLTNYYVSDCDKYTNIFYGT